MSFFSLAFPLFFLAVFALHWCSRRAPALARLWLLLASYAFYASWDWIFVPVLAAFSLLVAFCGARMRALPRAQRRPWLLLGVVLGIGNLAACKYYEFLREITQAPLHSLFAGLWPGAGLPALDLFLPVGLSFFTLQGLSYLFALDRDELAEPYSVLDVLCFIAFFPTLLSGPITRATVLLPQIRAGGAGAPVEAERAVSLLLLGIFKKLVLSSWLAAELVDPVFSAPLDAEPGAAWLAIYGYTLQIYCDFSGYSDIALGLALLLGYRLPANFDHPYLATSLRDFWRRWHISLSSWIRDYLYVPLGGSRGGLWRTCRNLLVAMVVSGVWHGANLTFIVWGGLHGLGMVVATLWRAAFPQVGEPGRLSRALGWLATFHFVALLWVFFRAASLDDALAVLRAAWPAPGEAGWPDAATLVFALAVAACMVFVGVERRLGKLATTCFRRLPLAGWPVLLVPAMLTLILLGPDGVPAFIYFSF